MTAAKEMPSSSKDAWDQNADFWVQIIRGQRDRYRTELTDAEVLDAIGDCTGLDFLDVGCGEGYMTRELVRRGASHGHGIDRASALIAAARRVEMPDVSFDEADVADLPFAPSSFDLVLANHLMNDLEDIEGPLSEITRVLRPGGRFIALMLHPCFYGHQAEQTAIGQPLAATEYFSHRVIEQPFHVDGMTSPAAAAAWVRPLEAYTKSLAGNGLYITGMTEPHPSNKLLASSEWWRKNFLRPLLMLITAQKLN